MTTNTGIMPVEGSEIKVTTGKTRHEALLKYKYSLSTFITLDFVLPIFYEENTKPDYTREYFCLFFDRTDKKFKVLSYVTEKSGREASYGTQLSKLLDNCTVVEDSEDFKKLALESVTLFAREHALVMEKLFRGYSIKSYMRQLYRVIQRCSKHPKTVSVDGREYEIFGLRPMRKSDNYTYHTTIVPICRSIQALRDILGKSSSVGTIPTTRIFVYSDCQVVGFMDVNFIQTAKSLLSQYRSKYGLYEDAVDKFANIKAAVIKVVEKLRN